MAALKKKLQLIKIVSIGYLAVSSLCISSEIGAAVTPASPTSVINISGNVIDEPCILTTDDIDVTFGFVTNKDIFYGNDEIRNFEIELVDCKVDMINAITVQFTGTSTDNNQLLSLNDGSSAKGVGIKIIDSLNNIITFGQDNVPINNIQQNNILQFKAVLTKASTVQNLNEIALGPFTATALFTIRYD